jgi:hypothetical protein
LRIQRGALPKQQYGKEDLFHNLRHQCGSKTVSEK